jgi:hypothetical protein
MKEEEKWCAMCKKTAAKRRERAARSKNTRRIGDCQLKNSVSLTFLMFSTMDRNCESFDLF